MEQGGENPTSFHEDGETFCGNALPKDLGVQADIHVKHQQILWICSITVTDQGRK